MKKYVKSATGTSYDVYVDLKQACVHYSVLADDIEGAYEAARELAKEDLEVMYCQPMTSYNVGVSLDRRHTVSFIVSAGSPQEAEKIALQRAVSQMTTSLE